MLARSFEIKPGLPTNALLKIFATYLMLITAFHCNQDQEPWQVPQVNTGPQFIKHTLQETREIGLPAWLPS